MRNDTAWEHKYDGTGVHCWKRSSEIIDSNFVSGYGTRAMRINPIPETQRNLLMNIFSEMYEP